MKKEIQEYYMSKRRWDSTTAPGGDAMEIDALTWKGKKGKKEKKSKKNNNKKKTIKVKRKLLQRQN